VLSSRAADIRHSHILYRLSQLYPATPKSPSCIELGVWWYPSGLTQFTKGPEVVELGWPGRSHKTIVYLFSPFFSFSATRVRISFHVILSISGWWWWLAGWPAAELLLDNCAASLVYTHITTINRIRRERGWWWWCWSM
jgi:hypothetical protein